VSEKVIDISLMLLGFLCGFLIGRLSNVPNSFTGKLAVAYFGTLIILMPIFFIEPNTMRRLSIRAGIIAAALLVPRLLITDRIDRAAAWFRAWTMAAIVVVVTWLFSNFRF
jgi:hypothetical protein